MTGTGFANPIVGGIGTLIRASIRSVDYVPGVSGWAIFRDGSAEFNQGTFRTDVVVGPVGSQIEITATVPPELLALYPAMGSVIILRLDALDYAYWGLRGSNRAVRGAVFGGVVNEMELFRIDTGEVRYGGQNPNTLGVGNPTTPTAAVLQIYSGADLQFGGVSAPQGVIAQVNTITDSSSIGGTETVVLTIPSATYPAGRAFRISYGNRAQGSVAGNQARFNCRKTNAAGTRLVDLGGTNNAVVGADYNCHGEGIFITSAAVTAAIALTLVLGAGTGTVQHVGTDTVRWAMTEDIGAAANFSGYTTLA